MAQTNGLRNVAAGRQKPAKGLVPLQRSQLGKAPLNHQLVAAVGQRPHPYARPARAAGSSPSGSAEVAKK